MTAYDIWLSLTTALVIMVMIYLVATGPGCTGNCYQGRDKCDCKLKDEE